MQCPYIRNVCAGVETRAHLLLFMTITKILSYTVYPPEGDAYDHVCRLLAQEIDPPSDHPHELALGGLVFLSPLRRAVECVDPQRAEVCAIEPLREIPFRLQDFCSREAFAELRSTAVRKAFVEGFVADRLLLSRRQLREDVLEVEKLAAAHPGTHFVSHTFRMKIFKLFYQTDGAIFDRPELMCDLLPTDKHWLAFGETLELPTGRKL